jgi:hypothetical protein
MIPAGMVERGERKQTVGEVSKADLDDVKTEGWHSLRDQLGRCPDTARAASGM